MGQEDVGHERVWDTERERERKRLYRERKRREQQAIEELAQALTPIPQGSGPDESAGLPPAPPLTAEEADERQAPGEGYVEFEGELKPVIRRASISEANYVRCEVEITREQLRAGIIRTNPVVNGRDRLDRTADYARWRYRGFLCGEVASL